MEETMPSKGVIALAAAIAAIVVPPALWVLAQFGTGNIAIFLDRFSLWLYPLLLLVAMGMGAVSYRTNHGKAAVIISTAYLFIGGAIYMMCFRHPAAGG